MSDREERKNAQEIKNQLHRKFKNTPLSPSFRKTFDIPANKISMRGRCRESLAKIFSQSKVTTFSPDTKSVIFGHFHLFSTFFSRNLSPVKKNHKSSQKYFVLRVAMSVCPKNWYVITLDDS